MTLSYDSAKYSSRIYSAVNALNSSMHIGNCIATITAPLGVVDKHGQSISTICSIHSLYLRAKTRHFFIIFSSLVPRHSEATFSPIENLVHVHVACILHENYMHATCIKTVQDEKLFSKSAQALNEALLCKTLGAVA